MDEGAVRERLAAVEDPDLGVDLVSLGVVADIVVDAAVTVTLALGAPTSPSEAAIVDAVEEALADVDRPVNVETTGEDGETDATAVLGTVDNVITVASGKGGVGKTTVAVNLATGLADRGATVGLFDADVYGPNAPLMVGETDQPSVSEEGMLVPPTANGVRVMSMAYLVGEDDPIIWRGPMVHKVITQLWEDVEWGHLDYLVIDLPPGTGDTQLTLLQTIPITGAVIVTTPQSLAIADAVKGLEMFGRHETNVLGIVENMAGFRCPDCGTVHDVFDAGGGAAFAERYDMPFLGSIPLDPAVQAADAPIVLEGDSDAGDAFRTIVGRVADNVGIVNRRRLSPPEA